MDLSCENPVSGISEAYLLDLIYYPPALMILTLQVDTTAPQSKVLGASHLHHWQQVQMELSELESNTTP